MTTKEPPKTEPPLTQPLKPHAPLDARRHAYRPDLAALSLYGRVNAPRYEPGVQKQVARPSVPLRKRPHATASFETEALLGEVVTVYEELNGWAWVQLARDSYVGYVPADVLRADVVPATHRVKALGTFVYPAVDFKTPPLMHLSLNSAVTVAEVTDRFCRLATGGFVMQRHITELGKYERDFVDIAERLIGTPYLWGGKTRIGLDCSGLVQLSLEAAGIVAPRDSDMQQAELGSNVLIPDSLEGLERGDLVFWRGHVGIMSDGVMMVHANAHHMAVVVEPLPEAAQRIAKAGSEISGIKRLPGLGAVG